MYCAFPRVGQWVSPHGSESSGTKFCSVLLIYQGCCKKDEIKQKYQNIDSIFSFIS